MSIVIYTVIRSDRVSPLSAHISLGTSAALDNAGHILRRIKSVLVEVTRQESLALVRSRLARVTLNNDTSASQRTALVHGDGVGRVNKVHILDPSIRAAPDVVAVRGHARKVVVVHVRVEQVVRGRVALVGAVEPGVVDGALGDDVLGPADAEGLVVVAEDGVGDGPVGGVFAEVDEAVAAGVVEDAVVDPDVGGAVGLDAVVVALVGVTGVG